MHGKGMVVSIRGLIGCEMMPLDNPSLQMGVLV